MRLRGWRTSRFAIAGRGCQVRSRWMLGSAARLGSQRCAAQDVTTTGFTPCWQGRARCIPLQRVAREGHAVLDGHAVAGCSIPHLQQPGASDGCIREGHVHPFELVVQPASRRRRRQRGECRQCNDYGVRVRRTSPVRTHRAPTSVTMT